MVRVYRVVRKNGQIVEMDAVADGDSVIMFGGVHVPIWTEKGSLTIFVMRCSGKLHNAFLPYLRNMSIQDIDFWGIYKLSVSFAPSGQAALVIRDGDSTCSLEWYDSDSAEVRNCLEAAATAG